MISAAVLLVAFLGFAAAIVTSSRLAEDTWDTQVVVTGFRNLVETLRAEDFSTLTERYGEGSDNAQFWCNPYGDIAFADPGESWISGDISFFTDETTVPATFAALGGVFDLNASGSVTTGESTDYKILPTRVSFAIENPLSGSREVTFDFILTPIESW